jgi:hypothetical protein
MFEIFKNIFIKSITTQSAELQKVTTVKPKIKQIKQELLCKSELKSNK